MKKGWTLERGFAIYRRELKKYTVWTEGLKKIYGRDFDPMGQLGSSDWKKLADWNVLFRGMEMVLGITKPEAAKILDEVRAMIPRNKLAA